MADREGHRPAPPKNAPKVPSPTPPPGPPKGTDPGMRIKRVKPSRCINCGDPVGSTAYSFGPHTPPGAPSKEVGPFDKKCYDLIYIHMGKRPIP